MRSGSGRPTLLALLLLLAPDAGSRASESRPNRLIREKSPYLLQHATNPMDWYPWGPEALEKARREDKPIFLSIGYSTCHWCHVMEAQVFTNDEIAAFLRDRFISIKVDREERPDLDATYMNATQLMTGRGGWPNSLFLTPDLKPFYAGSYIPRDEFRRIAEAIAAAWSNDRPKILDIANRAAARLRQVAAGTAYSGTLRPELLASAVGAIERRFDATDGGFDGAPKFPPHGALRILLAREATAPSAEVAKMLRTTLDRMAAGGIHDHLGGGFHRYSTDARWQIPHFEKMLYDNAQLAEAYLEASRLLSEPRDADVARGIFRWVAREMTGPEGGFYTAQDADSEGREGRYYSWTPQEVRAVLGPDPPPFESFYGVTEAGNFEGRTILHTAVPPDPAREREFERARERLLAARLKRVPPATDDKRVAGLNALMIQAYVRGYEVLGERAYLDAASRTADFIRTMLWDSKACTLKREFRNGPSALEGFLEDYAEYGGALLALHRATGDPGRLRLAREVADAMLAYFGEADGGFRESASAHATPLASFAVPFDNQEPAAIAVAADFLYRLGERTPGSAYEQKARASLRRYAGAIERAPEATGTFLTLYMRTLEPGTKAGTSRPEAATTTVASRDAGVRRGPVTASARWESPSVAAIDLTVEPGWHVNSGSPYESYLVPTKVSLDPASTGWSIGTVSYPPGRDAKFAFSDGTLSVYEAKTAISFPLAPAPGAGPAALRLTFQACDDRACLSPQTVVLTLPVCRTAERR